MAISTSIKQVACERLFHFHPLNTIARELGISRGAVRDWRIFVDKDDFDWVTNSYVQNRKSQLVEAVSDWITHYPIGFTDVARTHGVRPSDVYREIQAYLKRSPSAKLPLKLRHWKRFGPDAPENEMKAMQARIRKMVSEQIDSAKNEHELRRNIEEMLVTYECLFEEVMLDCQHQFKTDPLLDLFNNLHLTQLDVLK